MTLTIIEVQSILFRLATETSVISLLVFDTFFVKQSYKMVSSKLSMYISYSKPKTRHFFKKFWVPLVRSGILQVHSLGARDAHCS
jgi:hypothetical protein